jgi:hypothetical protein
MSIPIDNFDDFIRAYNKNVRQVSWKQMKKKMGKPNKSLLDANICWMVSDNMEELLKEPNKMDKLFEDRNVKNVKSFLFKHLNAGNIVTVFQDEVKEGKMSGVYDHWFTIIGEPTAATAHIVEYLQDQCPGIYTDTIDNVIHLLLDIMFGIKPDRFYHRETDHIYKFFAYPRKSLTAETVNDYVRDVVLPP